MRTNWAKFHFNNGNSGFNPYQNVLSPANVAGLIKAWSYHTGTVGYSSPAVVNGVVYVGSADGSVYALKTSTGAQLWSHSTGGDVFSSPAVANGVVYGARTTFSRPEGVHRRPAVELHAGAGQQSSPAVVNGVVYVGSYNGVV